MREGPSRSDETKEWPPIAERKRGNECEGKIDEISDRIDCIFMQIFFFSNHRFLILISTKLNIVGESVLSFYEHEFNLKNRIKSVGDVYYSRRLFRLISFSPVMMFGFPLRNSNFVFVYTCLFTCLLSSFSNPIVP